MTGKRYYLTTLGDWQRHAGRFVTSHFVVLDTRHSSAPPSTDAATEVPLAAGASDDLPGSTLAISSNAAAEILVLVEADEGAHLALEDDAAFEALPHPLTQTPISDRAQSALAAHGVVPGAHTFDAAEVLARVHPLLGHRVF